MGFKLVDRVYRLNRTLTSPSEQAVLLALAYRANDATLLCYPKQETLVQMTHLSRSAVARALNELREHGFIKWKSGGLANKKGKYGRPLANDYTLILPDETTEKRPKKTQPSVLQKDTPVSSSETLQCPPAGHTSVLQRDTPVSSRRTPTEIDNSHINTDTNRRTTGTASGLDGLAKELGKGLSAGRGAKAARGVEDSPLLMALNLCGLVPGTPTYRDNYRAFSSAMVKIGMERSMEIVRTIASERRQGELDGIVSLPRFVMSRLQAT